MSDIPPVASVSPEIGTEPQMFPALVARPSTLNKTCQHDEHVAVDTMKVQDDASPNATEPGFLDSDCSEPCPTPATAEIVPSDASNPVGFMYTPLESSRHIRLLKLSRNPNCKGHNLSSTGDSAPSPSCTLVPVNMDDEPLYTAISYTWEHEASDCLLSVNQQMLTIKQNVFDLLVALQRPHEDRYLWLDAICINQADDIEKSTQVRMMANIYASASYVISYLWSKHAHERDALRSAAAAIRKSFEEDRLALWKALDHASKIFHPPGDYGPETDILRNIIDLYSHRYFNRRWVVQEMELACSILLFVGDTEFALSLLLSFTEKWQRESYKWYFEMLKQCPALIRMKQRKEFLESPRNLMQAVSMYSDTECTRIEDRVFSLVSLSDIARECFQVDYGMTRAQLSCYTLAFSVQKENLPAKDAVRFASMLVEQLEEPPHHAGIPSQLANCRPQESLVIPCYIVEVSGLHIKNGLAEARAQFARKHIRHLPSAARVDLVYTSVDKPARTNEIPSEQEFKVPSEQEFNVPSEQEFNVPSEQEFNVPSEQEFDTIFARAVETLHEQDFEMPSTRIIEMLSKHVFEMPSEQEFSESLDSGHSLLQAPAFEVDPASYLKGDSVGTSPRIGLANARVQVEDQIWQLPGVSLALVVRLGESGDCRIVAVAHLLEYPESGRGIRATDFKLLTWSGEPKFVSKKKTRRYPLGQGRLLSLTIPTILRLARFSAYTEPA